MNFDAIPGNGTHAATFCPACFHRTGLRSGHPTIERTCAYCGERFRCKDSVGCPSPQCRRAFRFEGQVECPFCRIRLADAVPLQPVRVALHLLRRLNPSYRDAFRAQQMNCPGEYVALCHSWINESLGFGWEATSGTPVEEPIRIRHFRLLEQYADDVEKFLIGAPKRAVEARE